jgi:hypothetical protein
VIELSIVFFLGFLLLAIKPFNSEALPLASATDLSGKEPIFILSGFPSIFL